ncbi:MAG: LPP20 family lipoprotein [Spirochaetaceae bacterium]|nr:LPP20 family lipoprotein [Spirochaetaceae bacterium]
MKKIIALTGLFALLVSCASGPSPSVRPAWVDNKHSQYAEDKFMVEIGIGASLRDAKRNAAAALAQIFKTSIKVETTIQTRYKELSSGGAVDASEETTFDQDITQLADQELVNVNFGQSWTNDLGQVHVIAYIDRQVTANIYRDRIEENNSTVRNFISKSGDQSSQIRKYAYYDAAYVVARANQMLMEQLEIINLPIRKTIRTPYDINDVRDRRKEAALIMAFMVNIENDVEGKVASVLTDELTSFGFSIDPGGSLAVEGAVSFEKVELDNDYENVKYYLTINVEDENGIPIVALEDNDRISAVSESDAENRAYLEIEKIIKRDLIGKLIKYFDSFVE